MNHPSPATDNPSELPFAKFPIELELPAGDDEALTDARRAIWKEYQDCSKWKRLNCEKISLFAERERGAIYILHVGQVVEFDWTWEGAVAFMSQSKEGDEYMDEETDTGGQDVQWSGEIVEVDERNGCLFIALTNQQRMPTVGEFYVRPFEFLAGLNSIYHDSPFSETQTKLPARLLATMGGIHPLIQHPPNILINPADDSKLTNLWRHGWSVLWGPPGTGKTYNTGQQIAAVIAGSKKSAESDETELSDDADATGEFVERILVVSTTNRATDSVAIEIGKAARMKCPDRLSDGRILRIGKSASLDQYDDNRLDVMLRSTTADSMIAIKSLNQQLTLDAAWEEKALTRKLLGRVKAGANDRSPFLFLDPATDVVISTAFKAISLLRLDPIQEMLADDQAPFTTIFIDEAGLMPRASIAALSMLASRRVVLVGDSKQLAPISKMARLLPSNQKRWLASSGLSHLDDVDSLPAAVQVLREQRRMHPDICRVVSDFQYSGSLTTAVETVNRKTTIPKLLANTARAIWYVLDEEDPSLASIRSERGAGNRSWVRSGTELVLKKLFSDPEMKNSRGLFISPFLAQAKAARTWLGKWQLEHWEASTVHSQQGYEAEIVIFDTVNAGSHSWPFDEWKRLVNVGLSRAKQSVIVLASRAEMEEPHLRALVKSLSPQILVQTPKLIWQSVDGQLSPEKEAKRATMARENSLGYQIEQQKMLRPILSREQQQLSNLKLDGKPRLVRGVAGSGKTIVLSNWLARTVKNSPPNANAVWAVYGNRSLHKLLRQTIETAWQSENPLLEFPWEEVELFHIQDVLRQLLPTVALSPATFQFDYDAAAKEFLAVSDPDELSTRCRALFIDEAQDMGPHTLQLLLSLVEQTDANDENSRSANLFYDDAQNIYRRGRPRWSDFGIDLRGRSTIMKESFRSTHPITEYAMNVQYRLTDFEMTDDSKELIRLKLIEPTLKDDERWLNIHFNQMKGPQPQFCAFGTLAEEMNAIGQHLEHLIANEDVAPPDICILYNGEHAQKLLLQHLRPRLAKLDVEISLQKNRDFLWRPNTLLMTTPHSFKGYEAEVVLIPCADQYIAGGEILSSPLYVAMTRARSMLAIYSLDRSDRLAKRLNDVLESCS